MGINPLPTTLEEYIAQNLTRQFKWGEHDCMTFCIRWVESQSGVKYLPDEMWDSELSALREISRNGGIIAVLDLHFERVDANFAKSGDIALCNGVVSLFTGRHVVSTGQHGLEFKRRTEVSHAWTY